MAKRNQLTPEKKVSVICGHLVEGTPVRILFRRDG